MAIVWVASKLVIAFLIAKAFGQCPAEDITIGPGEIFSGKVEVGGEDDPQYVLLDDKGDRPGATGIHFVAGCNKVNEGEENLKVVLRLKNGAQALAFVLQQDPDPEIPLESKFLQLRPNVSYAELLPLPHSVNIIVEACSPSAEACTTKTSTSTSISIDIFNENPPKFNRDFGQGNLNLASCSGDKCSVPVILDDQITANDGDGGQVGIVFSHNLFTPSAFLFSTSSGSDSELVLTYVGTPSSFSSEDTQVVLMLQATEQRPDALITTIPLMVTVSGVPPTSTGAPETTPTTSCDKEEKYFISMVVLGACLGGLLTALVLILLCLCCKRICGMCGGSGSTDFSATSTNVSMRQSGVMAEGAAFRSFKDTTYLTLQEQHSPIGSTMDSPRVSYEPRTRYSDTDSTASADAAGTGGWRKRLKN